MKQRIHFHSDCSFFAGCENMLANFFNDDVFMGSYDVSFSYRASDEYEGGFRKRVTCCFSTVAMKLPDIGDVHSRIDRLPFPRIRSFFKALTIILLMRQFIIIFDTFLLYSLFKKEHIDILHVNNGGYPGADSCMAAVFAAKLYGIRKIIYVVNNIPVPYTSISRWLDYPFDRLIIKWVTYFITGSEYSAKMLSIMVNVPISKVRAITNGINLRKATENRKEVVQRLGIENDRFVFTSVSLLEERKGHIHLLRVLKEIVSRNIKLRPLPILLIEGCGPEFPNLRDYVDSNKLNRYVKFIGTEQNVFNVLTATDVFVESSVAYSPTPNVVAEAMGLGKPVIASIFSSSEQISHGSDGLLCNPENTDELVNIFVEIICDSSLRDRLSKNAKITFEKRFTARRAIEKYAQLYDGLTYL